MRKIIVFLFLLSAVAIYSQRQESLQRVYLQVVSLNSGRFPTLSLNIGDTLLLPSLNGISDAQYFWVLSSSSDYYYDALWSVTLSYLRGEIEPQEVLTHNKTIFTAKLLKVSEALGIILFMVIGSILIIRTEKRHGVVIDVE